jgi:signal transduction histidine kinase
MSSFADTDQLGIQSRRRDLLRIVAEGTAGVVGDEFLRCLVRHVAQAFAARFAFVAEATDPNGEHVRVVSGWYDGALMDEPLEYDTGGKPCALVVEHAVVAFPEALTERFPEAKPAIDMGLESYLAVCLRGTDGTHLGHLAVMDAGPMQAGDDDMAAMRIFASRAAAELERRQQAAALQRSRARVIEAADAGRRRVGRDLHDGAQQRLLAVGNLLRVARRKVGDDHEGAGVLGVAQEELGQAHAELRDLARGLHPVALSERGLVRALEGLAAGCDELVTIDVRADDLPEHVELATYFVVSESLTNAGKYAGATAIRIHVEREQDVLLVEITDDGRGGADAAAGTGLCGLADRVDALGGRFEVHSPAGAGTRVSARLPLADAG